MVQHSETRPWQERQAFSRDPPSGEAKGKRQKENLVWTFAFCLLPFSFPEGRG
jgi:hypothetical protein